jgi:hypothetical protein
MEQSQRYKMMFAMSIALLLGGVTFFLFANGDSRGSDSYFPIWIFMMPIWISIGAASRERNKRAEKAKRKQKDGYYDYLEDKHYLEDKVLSSYDGEIVSYDERDDENYMRRN